MKIRQILKTTITAAILSSSLACLAAAPADYVKISATTPVENVHDASSTACPYGIALRADPQNAALGAMKEICSLAASPSESDSFADKIANGKKNAKKAQAFLKGSKMADIIADKSNFRCFIVGKKRVLIFKPSPKGKIRLGRNFAVFEKNADGLSVWNVNFNDPFLALLCREAFGKTEALHIPANDIDAENAINKNLPFLTFQNGALAALKTTPNAGSEESVLFYEDAQKPFYALNLAEYANNLTVASAERFKTQFAPLPREEQKAALEDYLKWHKEFLHTAILGDGARIIFFRRVLGNQEQRDISYVRAQNGLMKIANWQTAQSPLDAFLKRHFLADKPYLESMDSAFGK